MDNFITHGNKLKKEQGKKYENKRIDLFARYAVTKLSNERIRHCLQLIFTFDNAEFRGSICSSTKPCKTNNKNALFYTCTYNYELLMKISYQTFKFLKYPIRNGLDNLCNNYKNRKTQEKR